ncbi:hypothetical protein ONA70_21095 [Micromonospora yasonensis]|uniref:hypothetical protein n=1 Tax=Micromonospora yasonensis TaxID=1128667 RepID=UPI00222E2880|nr:hypothetical protein [Micromonospora yasonensis]MCW3842600.1 hypothetical protein [Micromonospora yasonensis]
MRVLMTVEIDTDAGNRGIQDGSLPKAIQAALTQLKPEAAYFTTRHGHRTGYFVFDLREPAQMPQVAEPFFIGLNARIDMTPVMNAEDVQQGMSRVPQT